MDPLKPNDWESIPVPARRPSMVQPTTSLASFTGGPYDGQSLYIHGSPLTTTKLGDSSGTYHLTDRKVDGVPVYEWQPGKWVQLTDLSSLGGKTIARSILMFDQTLVIAFTDGSFFRVNASDSYDGPQLDCESNAEDYELLKLDLIDKVEYDRRKAERQSQFIREQERRNREMYERLKAQYAPTETP